MLRLLLSKIRTSSWFPLLMLLFACGLAYGTLIPTFGFYWDDWPYIYIIHYYQPADYWEFSSYDRPLGMWTFYIWGAILGDKPLNWHILTFILRYLATIAMWDTFCRIWPDRKKHLTLAALLFAIYPIFSQLPIAVTYHQIWTQFILFFISFSLMIKSLSQPGYYWIFTLSSITLFLSNIIITEYFSGVELLRPIIILIILNRSENNPKKTLLKTLKYWIPYITAFGLFVSWRLIFSLQGAPDPNAPKLLYSFFEAPIDTLIRLLHLSIQDLIYVFSSSWYKTFDPEIIDLYQNSSIGFLVASILFAGFLYFLLQKYSGNSEEIESNPRWYYEIIGFGLLAVLLACLPVWMTGRNASNGLYSNRFGAVAMFGASLSLIGLFRLILKNWKITLIITSILVGLGAGFHLRNSNEYRWSWVKQTRLYWQLIWRAPSIQPKTAIISETDILPFVAQYSFANALNTLYQPPQEHKVYNFWFFSLAREYAHDMGYFLSGSPIKKEFGSFTFTGNTKDNVVLYFSPPQTNCLWVLKPEDVDDPVLPALSRQAASIANNMRINNESAGSAYPDEQIFGSEPDHDWCYYYEKGELARQDKNWQKLANLIDEARGKGYTPNRSGSNSPHEWMAFIEGYGYTNRWQEAEDLTMSNYQIDPRYRRYLCSTWKTIESGTTTTTERQNSIQNIRQKLNCP